MENNNFGKFLAGAVVGAGLGIAAGIFLSSKRGKELMENTKEMMKDFYDSVADKAEEIKKMGTKEYKDFMKQAVKKYADMKDVSKDEAKHLFEEVQKSWEELTEAWQD